MVKKAHKKTDVIEEPYQAIPKFRGLKSFDNSFLSNDLINPSYTELGANICQLLTTVYNLSPLKALLCIRAFLDSYVQITSKEHTEITLTEADKYLNLFFEYLPIFEDVTSSTLSFPKIHMLTNYTNDVRRKGSIDGYSTNPGG